MIEAFFFVLLILVVLFVVHRVKVARKKLVMRAIEQSGALSAQLQSQLPTTLRQRNVTVTVHPPTITTSGDMSGLAGDILKSMGGAGGILNMPEVQEALRQATQHPGSVTTVSSAGTSASPLEAGASSPFDTGNSPFAESAGTSATPFSSAPTPSARGEMAVAQVLSAPSTTFDGTREVSLELDAIGAPKRRVVATVPDGNPSLEAGSRIYVQMDPQDASRVTLTGGMNVLPQGSNRLDPLVLGPQIYLRGAHGKAVVKAAAKVNDASGGGSWQLDLEVTPERGWPYRAELLTTVSTPEKAARVCVVGAELPVLYDPDDPKTMCVDSVALGYGNPFAGR